MIRAAIYAVSVYLLAIVALSGPLRGFVPKCEKVTFGFCLEPVNGRASD